MDDQVKLAFEFASELPKQLITLSTAIIGLTVTFLKEFRELISGRERFLTWSWLLMIVSIVFGILSLMALTGALVEDTENRDEIIAIPTSAKINAGVQIVTFIFGIVSLTICGFRITKTKKSNAE